AQICGVERWHVGVRLRAPEASALELLHGDALLALERGQGAGYHRIDEVRFTGANHAKLHLRIGHVADIDAVEPRLAFVPVVGEAFDGDVAIWHPLDELERTTSDGRATEVLSGFLRGRWRNDEPRSFAEGGQHRTQRAARLKLD